MGSVAVLETFDIFDTCLVRRVADPTLVFREVARALGLGDDYRALRAAAEVEARGRYGPEVTLEEIGMVLGELTGWGAGRVRELLDAELAEETRQLRPVPGMLARVREARGRGCRIMFLSDMYLPSDFLRERLVEFGFLEDGDVLEVSGESRRSKATGKMFQAWRGDGTEEWVHTGNDERADVSRARSQGIRAIHFPAGNLSRYEQLMLSGRELPGERAENWAGASRLARLETSAATDEEVAITSVSSGVAAPLVYAFVNWLVEEAGKAGLDRLYFLARDGQCLLKPFERVAAARGLELGAAYLHASRIAWRFPRVFPMNDAAAAGVFQESFGRIPLAVVAARLGIESAELKSFIPPDCIEAGFIPDAKIPVVRESLAGEPARERLQAVADERVELLLEYLNQRGVLGGGPIGLVDIGWAGSLQAGIGDILASRRPELEIKGFYLGLRHESPADRLDAKAFLFDKRRGDSIPGPWMSTLGEVFFQADHGSTLGFSRAESGEVVPRLDEPDGGNRLVPRWLRLHREAIEGFVNHVLETEKEPPLPSATKGLMYRLIMEFWARPTVGEARTWGAIEFSSAGLSAGKNSLAPAPRSIRDLAWIMGTSVLGVGSALWREGAAALLPRPLPRAEALIRRVRRVERNRFSRTRSERFGEEGENAAGCERRNFEE